MQEEQEENVIGTKERPYLRTPPKFIDEGLPWGAYCQCDDCGFVARSTAIFDYYDNDGVLVCGACLGFDIKSSAFVAEKNFNEDDGDQLGPGCRGGYDESLG